MTQSKPLSASALKSLSKSPELCYMRHLDPDREYTSTPAAELGKLIHELALLPKSRQTVRKMPEGMQRRGAEYQALRERADYDGVTLVPATQWEKAASIVDRIKRNSAAWPILRGKNGSVRREYRHEWFRNGTWMVAIFDRISSTHRSVTDLKTTSNLDRLDKVAADGLWGLQAAVYAEGAADLYGCHWRDIQVPFVVAETVEPYRVRVVRLDQDLIEMSCRQFSHLRLEYMRRLKANDWTGENEIAGVDYPVYSKQNMRGLSDAN